MAGKEEKDECSAEMAPAFGAGFGAENVEEEVFGLDHKGIKVAGEDGVGEVLEAAKADAGDSIGAGEHGHRHGHIVDLPAANCVEVLKENPPEGKEDEVVANHKNGFGEKGASKGDGGADAGPEKMEVEH